MDFKAIKEYLFRNRTVGIAAVLLSVLVFYAPSYDLKLFADDYISWATVKSTLDQSWWRLITVYYNPEFYRPLDLLLIRANMELFGDSPFLYRWATIFGHMLAVLSVYWFVRRLRFDRATALLAAAYFGLGHANAMAALSNDAASQVYSTFCGTMAMGFAIRRYPDRPLLPWELLLSAAWLMGSLLWKDAGISFVPALALLLLWEWRKTPRRQRVRRVLAQAAPFVAVVGVYFLLRLNAGAAGPTFCGPGRYDLCLGVNVVKNLGLFLLGLITPVGSSIVVLRLQSPLFMTAWVVSLLAVAGIWLGGLYAHARQTPHHRERLVLLAALLFLVMLPDIFMNRVSELYVYKPNVVFATMIGVAAMALVRWLTARRQRVALVILVVMLAAIAFSNAKSIVHKTQRMRTGGLWAARLMGEIQAQLPTLPSHSIIVTNRDPGPAPFYSIYYMEGAYVLGGGKIFEFYYGEKIEEYRFYPWEQMDRALADLPGKKVILLYEQDHVWVTVSPKIETLLQQEPSD